jgi:hypothetical protein
MFADLTELWRKSDRIARFALLVAGAAVLSHLASLLGAGWSQLLALGVVLHLSVTGLVIGLFVATVRDRLRGSWRAYSPRRRVPLPRRLVWLCLSLALYALLWFLGAFAYYGEGGTEIRNGMHVWVRGGEVIRQLTPAQAQGMDAHGMSIFSAMWVAAALPLAIAYQRRKTRRELPAIDLTSAA